MPLFFSAIFQSLLFCFGWIFKILLGGFFTRSTLVIASLFSFAIPLLTNTIGKLIFGFGGGIAVYQLGDSLFNYLFSKISEQFLYGVPLKLAQFSKLIGVDTGINIFVSFLFALLVVKGMDKYGTIKRSVWNRPFDHLPSSGKWDA